jgi:hypothetical protein
MNTPAVPAAETRQCLRCGRKLRSAEAVARGYGAGCWAKVRKAERTVDLSAWTESQVEDARQAIEDGAVVPSTREGVFHVVSVDGSEVHRTHRDCCNCTAGLKTYQPRPCWHRCAIAIVLASQSSAKPLAPAAAPALAPVFLPAPADIWAEIERLNEAFMTAA